MKRHIGVKRGCQLAVAVVLLSTAVASIGTSNQVSDQQVSDELRRILESASVPLNLQIGDETVLATLALPSFYEKRVYQPAWTTGQGSTPAAEEFARDLSAVAREGLRPEEYHVARLRQVLVGFADSSLPPSPTTLAELDLLLTDAFLMLGAHLVSGRVDPASFDREWLAVRREVDLVQVLNSALENEDISGALGSLLPDHHGYFQLRELGERYVRLTEDGGWQPISPGPPLKQGDSGPRVEDLRLRLKATDDLVVDGAGSSAALFDEEINAAVRRFQSRHGLDSDGVVGAKTLEALNVSARERLQQIYLNLERWRWLPQSLGERYVLVNLPSFDLRVVESGTTSLAMRVAVGRRYRRTPVFSDTIRYLVFNPYWEIPAGIAARDKLPEILKDPAYLEKQGMHVLTGWGTDQKEVVPSMVDWGSLGVGHFPYRLRQDPGPLNALGRVKFMFPNRFNVYLHDTPGREVFNRAERDVSSGCIRLEKPMELAELLLRDNSDWGPGAREELLRDYQERTISLAAPWPVHLLHWTAWVDEDRVAHFRSDLYERDEKLLQALAMSPSRSGS